VTTSGNGSAGIDVRNTKYSYGGYTTAMTVNADDISTSSSFANGINAVSSDSGTVAINVGSVSTQGYYSSGIRVTADYADVAIDAGSVTTAGDEAPGIYAVALGGDVTVSGGTVQTKGYTSDGIYAVSLGGNVTVTSDGSVSTQGYGSEAVRAIAFYGAGDATVTVNDVSTAGDNSPAIIAQGNNVSVTVNGDVSTQGANSPAIIAYGSYGTATIVDHGAVSTAGDYSSAIYAGALGDVSITGEGAVSTQGYRSEGIVGYSQSGAVSITAANVTTTGDLARGIDASAPQGEVSVTAGSVSTAGYGAFGIIASTNAGNIAIDADTVSTTGDQATGILAISSAGNIDLTAGSISTAGYYARGVTAVAFTGDITVDSGSVTTTGAYATGLNIQATGADGNVAISAGTVATAGDRAYGIRTFAGNAATITATSVTTTGGNAVGIYAGSLGDGDVSVTAGTVTTSGYQSDGIIARSNGGNVTIDAGTVSLAGDDATAVAGVSFYGDTSITVGDVTTQGDTSAAVIASGYNADVIATGTVSTAGDASPAIAAIAYNDASVTSTGTIKTAGAGSNGIYAYSGAGSATVTAHNVSTTGAGSDAIVVDAGTTGTVTVSSGGTISGAQDGIALSSVDGSIVNNAGTINTGAGYAIDVTGATATINNSGTINGRVLLTAGDDNVNNSGTFAATSNSDFGAGDDVFNNSGRLTVGTTGTPRNVTLTGLETFNNSGIVDLRNGVVGDVLTLPGSFTGTGASALGVDVGFNTGTTTADRLNVGTAAGSTLVSIAAPGNGAVFTSGVTIVQAAAASSATAFAINPAASNAGFVHYTLAYNPATFAYQLVGGPSAAAFATGTFAEGTQQLWYKTADAISAHLTAARDSGGQGASDSKGGAWLQMFGQSDLRKDGASFTGDGSTIDNVNLGFTQDSFGGQLGYDIGGFGEGSGVMFGITGGYQNSVIRLRGSGDRVDFDAVDAGAYAAFKAGPLFVNGLAKYDRYWGHAHNISLGYADKLHGDSYGGQIEAGLRLGSEGFFAEPIATIAYVHTSLDDLHALGSTFDFDGFNGLRGKAGLRIGGTSNVAGNTVTFYASGEAVHEFKGHDDVTISNAGGAFSFRTARLGTYGKGTIGFNVSSASPVSGFVEGFGDYGKDYRGGGGRAGLRLKF
jgi:hypothetical protein